MKYPQAILFLLFCSFALLSCKKKTEKPILPPITTTGENTFGCYIDGEPYAIFDGTPNPWYHTWTKIDDLFANGTLEVFVQKENPRWRFNIMTFNPNHLIGTFISSGEYPYISECQINLDGGTMPSNENLYYTSNLQKIKVVYSIAISGMQYSGTFSGEMINSEGKIIKITEGRFDIKKN